MKTKILLLTMLLGMFMLNSCKKKNAEQQENKQTSCEKVEWGYKGEEGPEEWADLCSGFGDCDGVLQSPINIDLQTVVTQENAPELKFSYGNTPVVILNNGHTIQFNVSGDNFLNIGNEKFRLLQLHYHAASEHMVDGKHYPMEVHFVHKGANKLAVVGIFFEKGKSNPLLENYLTYFPKKKGKYEAEKTIPLSALVPENVKYYHYDGSLTTPPCSEIVDWYVLQEPITASEEQLEQMKEILHGNYRPVQDLNDRKVVKN